MKNDLSQYQSFEMSNSQLKRLEEFDQMTQSNKKRQYINAQFLGDSNDTLQIKDDIFNQDVNLMSDDEVMKIIMNNQTVELVLQKASKRQQKYQAMLQNVKKLNNQHFKVIDS